MTVKPAHALPAMNRHASVVVVMLLGWLVTSVPVFAQDDVSAEVSAGYLNVSGSMHGWSVQASKLFAPNWALVGEVAGARGRDCVDCDPAFNDVAVLGGIRYTWPGRPRVSPSWQLLAGVLHSVAQGYYADPLFGGSPYFIEGYTVNYLAIQPGVGLTFMVTPRVGISTQADLQLAIPDQTEYEGVTAFPRVTIGAVVRFGTR